MSQRRKLRQHLRQLTEISNIMEAMKNLAVLETHKLSNLLANQHLSVKDLESTAADFLAFHPGLSPPADSDHGDCWILFGSERGFCGDFNETLITFLESRLTSGRHATPLIIPVGNKLCVKLEGDSRVTSYLTGADVAEEINSVLNEVISHINELQSRHGLFDVHVLYHREDSDEIASSRLLPPFRHIPPRQTEYGFPPLLNLAPADFFSDLADRYLFAALQEIGAMSLMAENHARIRHMTGAVQRLEETTDELLRRYHRFRQEEITEEIEVILLNSTGTV